MRKSCLRICPAVLMALSVAVVLLLAGCGSSTTTTAAPTSTTAAATTTTAEAQKVVVGGKDKADYEAAIPELEKKLQSTPNDPALLQDLAVAQYNLKKYDDAAKTYEKMLTIEDKAMVRNNYANVLRDAGKPDLAEQEYRKAIKSDATLAVAYVNLASIMVKDNRKDEALKLLDEGIGATGEADKKRLQAYKDQLTATKE